MPIMPKKARVVRRPTSQVASKGKGAQAEERLRGRKLQAARLRIWAADPCCQMCDALTQYPDGFQLDHKVALTNGGTNEDGNLQVLCLACHEAKTAQDMGHKAKRRIGLDGWPIDGNYQ